MHACGADGYCRGTRDRAVRADGRQPGAADLVEDWVGRAERDGDCERHARRQLVQVRERQAEGRRWRLAEFESLGFARHILDHELFDELTARLPARPHERLLAVESVPDGLRTGLIARDGLRAAYLRRTSAQQSFVQDT
jgi:hypothetical protein